MIRESLPHPCVWSSAGDLDFRLKLNCRSFTPFSPASQTRTHRSARGNDYETLYEAFFRGKGEGETTTASFHDWSAITPNHTQTPRPHDGRVCLDQASECMANSRRKSVTRDWTHILTGSCVSRVHRSSATASTVRSANTG